MSDWEDRTMLNLREMTDAERMEFFERLASIYCMGCGGPAYDEFNQHCQCQNDE